MFSRGILLLAIVLPATRPVGLWDRWPSWGLYAPGDERTTVLALERHTDAIPLAVPLGDASQGYREVLLDEWVIEQVGVPRYPSNRVAMALAEAVEERANKVAFVRFKVISQSAAARVSGRRKEDERSYWLNQVAVWTE